MQNFPKTGPGRPWRPGSGIFLLGIFLMASVGSAAQSASGGGSQSPENSAAQQAAGEASREQQEAMQMLDSRDKLQMHGGDPFDIIGLEEGDNGFRSRTPGLLNSDRQVAAVERNENYRRRLAMYEGGAVFHQAPSDTGENLEATPGETLGSQNQHNTPGAQRGPSPLRYLIFLPPIALFIAAGVLRGKD